MKRDDLSKLQSAYAKLINESHDETGTAEPAATAVDPTVKAKATLDGIADIVAEIREGFLHNRDYINSPDYIYNLDDLKAAIESLY